MTTRSYFDLNQAIRLLGVLVLVMLSLLVALAVGLMVVAESHLKPLQADAEAISEAQVQLVGLMVKKQGQTGTTPHTDAQPEHRSKPWRKPASQGNAEGSDQHADLLQVVDALSGQVKRSVDNLEWAQEGYLNMARTVSASILLLVVLLGFLALLGHRRVLRPIRELAGLLRRLARRDFSPEPLDGADTVLHPVFESYNALVNRLARLEKAHELRHEETERQVTEAVRVLMAQRAELDRVERLAAVGEVAAMLAHEIRNPLAAMRAACRSLIEDVTDDDHRDRLGLIAEEVDRLIALVREQLDHTRYRPEDTQDTDVARLIDNLAQLVAYQMPEGVDIDVRVQRPLAFSLAPNGLRRSLLNLIRNAQQALGAGGGRIQVSAGLSDGALKISVEDEGGGFPPALLQQGVRAFASSRDDGTGLGLSMVKRFAEEHGGRLELGNLPGGGARVTLCLPARSP